MIPKGKDLRRNDPAFKGGADAPWKRDSEKEGKYRKPANSKEKDKIRKAVRDLAMKLNLLGEWGLYGLVEGNGDEYTAADLILIREKLKKEQEKREEFFERYCKVKKLDDSDRRKNKKTFMQNPTYQSEREVQELERLEREERERQDFQSMLADI